MSICDHKLISERYFFPRPGSVADVKVAVSGATLACASNNGGHAQTLLHFHGNGEIVDDYVPGFPELMDGLHLNTFFAEYRGYGGSTGTPLLATMLGDVDALVEAAGGPEDLIVFGRSIGSIYAIETARRYPQIAGLVLESGIANVLERILLRASPSEMGASPDEVRAAFAEHFDHHAKLSKVTCPTLILHAEHDHLVDKSHAEQNAASVGGPCKLVILPRGDHNSIFFENREQYLAELKSFAEDLRSH